MEPSGVILATEKEIESEASVLNANLDYDNSAITELQLQDNQEIVDKSPPGLNDLQNLMCELAKLGNDDAVDGNTLQRNIIEKLKLWSKPEEWISHTVLYCLIKILANYLLLLFKWNDSTSRGLALAWKKLHDDLENRIVGTNAAALQIIQEFNNAVKNKSIRARNQNALVVFEEGSTLAAIKNKARVVYEQANLLYEPYTLSSADRQYVVNEQVQKLQHVSSVEMIEYIKSLPEHEATTHKLRFVNQKTIFVIVDLIRKVWKFATPGTEFRCKYEDEDEDDIVWMIVSSYESDSERLRAFDNEILPLLQSFYNKHGKQAIDNGKKFCLSGLVEAWSRKEHLTNRKYVYLKEAATIGELDTFFEDAMYSLNRMGYFWTTREEECREVRRRLYVKYWITFSNYKSELWRIINTFSHKPVKQISTVLREEEDAMDVDAYQ